MTRPSLFLLVFSLGIHAASAQALENGDFSKGKAGWLGSGQVVYLKADGTVSPAKVPDAELVMQVALRPTQWTWIKQSLHPHAADHDVAGKVTLKASADFAPMAESRDYSKVDFQEGGGYVWSADVWPKCDLLVKLQDTTWYYQPKSLKPYGEWKTVKFSFPNLSSRNRSLTLALPPGKGSVFFKSVE